MPMVDGGHILIVDDESDNREVLEQELELLGCSTAAAADGHSALQLLEIETVDLILLDVMMPRLDGFEVLRRIKNQTKLRHLPVIMISALADIESVVRCIELGAEDYLPKPFDPVLLKARISACLEKKRWHDREVGYLDQIENQLGELRRERKHTERLLHAILPAPAVIELKATNHVIPKRYENVAVLCADIADFTPYCEKHPAEEVISNLDHLFRHWEGVVVECGLDQIKSIGDGVLAAANLFQPTNDPVMACLCCTLGLARAAKLNPARWQIRVGIHIGSVVAGVVGRTKLSFDLWGDTVNIAARLSGLGVAGSVHLSGDAWTRISGRCRGEALGLIPLKGRSDIEVFRYHETGGEQMSLPTTCPYQELHPHE
jgi:adenylate cyclase